jgi:hypothetical protein
MTLAAIPNTTLHLLCFTQRRSVTLILHLMDWALMKSESYLARTTQVGVAERKDQLSPAAAYPVFYVVL